MFIGLLISGAMLYTSANLIAYDDVVDRVKNSETNNKNKKGLAKFLTGTKNVLARGFFFPAFISKAAVEYRNSEKFLMKQVEKKGKKEHDSKEKVELAKKIVKSKLAEVGNVQDKKKVIDESFDLAREFMWARNYVEEFANRNGFKGDLGSVAKRFETGIYDLTDDTLSHKEVMKSLDEYAENISSWIKINFNNVDTSNYKDIKSTVEKFNLSQPLLSEELDIMLTEARKRIERKQITLAQEITDLSEQLVLEVPDLNDKEKLNAQAAIVGIMERENNSILPAYQSLLEMYKLDPNLTLDEIINENQKDIIALADSNKYKKEELLHVIQSLPINDSLEVTFTDPEYYYDLLQNQIQDYGLDPNDEEVQRALSLAKDLKEAEENNKVEIKNLELINKICTIILHPELEKRKRDGVSEAEIVLGVIKENIDKAKSKLENSAKLYNCLKEMVSVREDYEKLLHCQLLSEVPNAEDLEEKECYSVGYFHLRDIVNYYFSDKWYATPRAELMDLLDEKVGMEGPLTTAYQNELYAQTEIAKTLATILTKDVEKIISMIKDNFAIDLQESNEVIEEEVPEEVIEAIVDEAVEAEKENDQVDIIPVDIPVEEPIEVVAEEVIEEVVVEEVPEEVIEVIVDEAVEAEKENDKVDSIPVDIPVEVAEEVSEEVVEGISKDLTGNENVVVNVEPATNFKKVNYQKYETVDLTEAEIAKLTGKQKFIYDLISQYGEDGLPVGLFTAIGIKMPKFVKKVGEKYEADYTEEAENTVIKIINDELNNDLYLATNGNEKIQVVRYPIKSVNVTKNRIEVIEDISSKYKVCLVKGLTEAEKEALKSKYGDKITFHNEYIIFSTKEKAITKATNEYLYR